MSDVLDWLLEPENPSARYLTLKGLLGRAADDPEVVAAREAIPDWGAAKAILEAQWPEGYWVEPGVGYSPKYRATVWQVIFLGALGAPRTEAIARACAYVLDHSRLPDGRFSAHRTAQGAVTCLHGNLLRAMLQLGYADPRLDEVAESLAQMVARDDFRCRFNAPGAAQGRPPARMDEGLPCAWGAVKALGAFAELPEGRRNPLVQAAIEAGLALLLDGDLASGDFPTGGEPSPLWSRFGFPLGYTSDLLEALEVLARLGVLPDARLKPAIDVVRRKQDERGRWALEYTPERTWASFGKIGRPNKWITIRALCVLKAWGQEG